MASPAWEAEIKVSPALFTVAVVPETETTVEFEELKVTGKPDDAVAESNEANNTTGVYNIWVACVLEADLIIAPATPWPAAVDEGEAVNLPFTTSNIGAADAFNFTDTLFIDNGVIGMAHVMPGRSATAGGSNTSGYTWVPTECDTTYNIWLETDSDGVIIESTEISGMDVFEEIVNLNDITGVREFLKEKLIEIAKDHGEELKAN